MRNHRHTSAKTYTQWHSGDGYNRVRVCSCGAEDHDPTPDSIGDMFRIIDETEPEFRRHADGSLPDFIGDGPDEIRTHEMLLCPWCRAQFCEHEVVDFETHRRMLLEAREQ